jgi:alkanesulfonate monooxygenase SsuD/methylene tetrahydromethanopterin reductase-like flavin-dependent oxidoreductase (luciferase family)
METDQILKGLCMKDAFEFHGEFFDIPPVVMGPRPARQPPVYLGGFNDAVLKRVGEHCEGWLPAYAGTKVLALAETDQLGPDHMRQGRAKIERFAREAGFDIGVILASGDEHGDYLRMYEDAGADRIAYSMPKVASESQAREAVEKLAEILL